jgi:hypothetical protein
MKKTQFFFFLCIFENANSNHNQKERATKPMENMTQESIKVYIEISNKKENKVNM